MDPAKRDNARFLGDPTASAAVADTLAFVGGHVLEPFTHGIAGNGTGIRRGQKARALGARWGPLQDRHRKMANVPAHRLKVAR